MSSRELKVALEHGSHRKWTTVNKQSPTKLRHIGRTWFDYASHHVARNNAPQIDVLRELVVHCMSHTALLTCGKVASLKAGTYRLDVLQWHHAQDARLTHECIDYVALCVSANLLPFDVIAHARVRLQANRHMCGGDVAKENDQHTNFYRCNL